MFENLITPFRPYINQLSNRYEALNSREKNLLLSLAGVFFIAILYFFFWIPLQEYAQNAEKNYEREVSLNAWMQEKSVLFSSPGSKKGKTPITSSLLSLANTSAASFNLSLKGAEPKSNDSLRIWMDDVSIDALLDWLYFLYDTYGIEVENINLDKQALEGRVRVNLVVHR